MIAAMEEKNPKKGKKQKLARAWTWKKFTAVPSAVDEEEKAESTEVESSAHDVEPGNSGIDTDNFLPPVDPETPEERRRSFWEKQESNPPPLK